MSFTTFARPIQIKLWQFCESFANQFSRPVHKFIRRMLFGILHSDSVHLNSIGRSLQEHLALKKVTQRLSAHLVPPRRDGKKLPPSPFKCKRRGYDIAPSGACRESRSFCAWQQQPAD